MYDLIIVGGGPAGMSASLVALKEKIHFLLLTESGTISVDFFRHIIELKKYDYPHVDYPVAYQLIHAFNESVTKGYIPVKLEHVISIKKSSEFFSIKTNHAFYEAKSILIATGRRCKKLEDDLPVSAGCIHYCVFCDGSLFENKMIAIIEAGKTGILSTLFMLRIARKIYVIEQTDEVNKDETDPFILRLLEYNPHLEFLHNTALVAITNYHSYILAKIRQHGNERTILLDGLFSQIGYKPNIECIADSILTNNKRELVIDSFNMTSITGMFAAGDVTHIQDKTVNVAMKEGEKAVYFCIGYLATT